MVSACPVGPERSRGNTPDDMFRAFMKKSRRTPKGHIEMARRRMADYEARQEGG